MKNTSLYILLFAICMQSCTTQTIDFRSIDTNNTSLLESLKTLQCEKIESQKGHWNISIDNDDVVKELVGDEISTHYVFRSPEEIGQIKFDRFPLDDFPVKVVSYDKRVSFASMSFKRESSFQALISLKQKLGEPDRVYKDIPYDKEDVEVKLLLEALDFDSEDLKKTTDEYDDTILSFPEHSIWGSDDFIFMYTLLRGRESYGNSLVIINKKVFKDKIIFGYHNPEEDPILKDYLK